MKVATLAADRINKVKEGSTGAAEMPKPRRTLFRQKYWKSTQQHPDNTVGDPFGTISRREETTGGQVH
jgi:hypothetical protein